MTGGYFRLIIIGCAAPEGLKHVEQLILAYSYICTAGFGYHCRIRSFQHFTAVCDSLHFHTQAEICVAGYLIVNDTSRLLCSQNKMYTQTSSHSCH